MRIFWPRYEAAAAFLGLLMLLAGCMSPPDNGDLARPVPSAVIQDGVEIPHFASARDQLNYAKSGFNDLKEKKAAFRAVLTLFPGDRDHCGHAAAGLAYLHLEPDYRFATDLDIRQAVNDFSDILEAYPDLSDVAAKVHWYLGWIHTDLIRDPDTGIRHFLYVADHFSGIPMTLAVPVPWANLVSAGDPPQVLTPAIPDKFWGETALLQVVRSAEDPALAIHAFDRLFDAYPHGYAAGFALKAMLQRPGGFHHALPRVEEYLARETDNPYLANEIRMLAQRGHP